MLLIDAWTGVSNVTAMPAHTNAAARILGHFIFSASLCGGRSVSQNGSRRACRARSRPASCSGPLDYNTEIIGIVRGIAVAGLFIISQFFIYRKIICTQYFR
jgi:hypothetical protein